MQDCQVCGRSFDPLAFQVVVPELGRGFDRIECARSARALALPGSKIAAAPLVAIVEPIAGVLSPAMAAAPAGRRFAAPVAALGLLAAGTAVAVVLWLRVLGPDTASFPFSRAAAPPALGHETVQAQVQPASGSHPAAEAPARPAATPATALIAARGEPPAASPTSSTPRSSPPVSARPTPPPVVSPPTLAPTRGKEHAEHGKTGGAHSPGHGHHGKHGHGHHKGKAKGKH